MAKLVVQGSGGASTEFPLVEGLNRVGRASDNEVRLDDGSVSASHCELWLMKERLLVRDLGSTNGTFVDGRPVTECELFDGVALGVGRIELRVIEAPVRVAIPKAAAPPPPPRFTADGIPCCIEHPQVAARYRCTQCGEQLCGECVRQLGRRGGSRHVYCGRCNGECVTIVPLRSVAAKPGGGPSGWLAKLTQTLRLRR